MADSSVSGPGGRNRFNIEVPDSAMTMAEIKPTVARFRSEPMAGPEEPGW